MILSTKQHEVFHQGFLMLFSFLLPLHPRLAILSIILCGINWLLSGMVINNFKILFKPLPLLFIGFYFLHVGGMIHTDHLVEGTQRLETKLPLLIFPLILFTFSPNVSSLDFSKRIISKIGNKNLLINSSTSSIFLILVCYVLGCFTSSVYSILCGVYKYVETGENWMHYKMLGSFLGFHPTYFSIYISFAFFIVLFFGVKKSEFHFKIKLYLALLLGWFLLFILLLSSRMTILATAVILGASFLSWMYLNQKLLKGITISFFALVLFGISLKNLPGLKIRTNATLQRIEKQRSKQGVSDPRINLWSAALTVIRENLIMGTGTGDAQSELTRIYKENNYERELKENYNPHNQYLQTTVTLGIIGGVFLVFYLMIPFWLAYRHGDYLYLLFLSLILLSFLTESILQTQRGTLFFGFFHTLFSMQFLSSKNQ